MLTRQIQLPYLLSLAFFLGLTSCSNQMDKPSANYWQEIGARNQSHSTERPLIYRAMIPNEWQRIALDPSISLIDTMKPIDEYWIQDEESKIRLTIHTFPINASTPHIPPFAQIQRWKEQFEELNPLLTSISPESRGGYTGLFLEAEGLYQNEQTGMLGWSMQLAPEFERQLSLYHEPLDSYKLADFTIKALGTAALIKKHKRAIVQFAQSFELIEELPHPL